MAWPTGHRALSPGLDTGAAGTFAEHAHVPDTPGLSFDVKSIFLNMSY